MVADEVACYCTQNELLFIFFLISSRIRSLARYFLLEGRAIFTFVKGADLLFKEELLFAFRRKCSMFREGISNWQRPLPPFFII